MPEGVRFALPMRKLSPSLAVLKPVLRALLTVMLCLLSSGCGTDRDISRHPGQSTDLRVGNVYQLKVPAFILAGTGLLVTMEEARQQPPARAEALLEPGTYLKVQQIKAAQDESGSPRTDIYAEILSGPSTKRVVNLRTVCHQDASGAARRDNAVLVPFFMGR